MKGKKKTKRNFGILFVLLFLFVCFKRKKKKKKIKRTKWLNYVCFGVEPMKISSLSIDAKVALARVLEGCCLLHWENMNFMH